MAISCVSLFFFFFSFLLSHGIVDIQASHHEYKNLQSFETTMSRKQPYRTGYHFQSPKNWINAPMIYKGIYHLFYQYNPKGVVWGNIVWAHSTSTDLVNWTPHDPAIYPSQPSDINGCWSGSATILPSGKPVILYTGIDPSSNQVQNLAMPKNLSDPYLREWVKSPKNPVMAPNAKNQINASSFRDPTTAWLGHDRKWRVTIGSKVNRKGLAYLFTSKDFVHWTQSRHLLHSANDTGMWECVDLYPVDYDSKIGIDTSVNGPNIKHVLKISLDDTRHDIYTIGTYNPDKDIYIPDEGSVEGDSGLRYDYGKFYASKTFFDSETKRRILWGWINESSTVEDDIKKGWSGIQAIPRVIWLNKSRKQLIQWPITEIEKLRTKQVKIPSKLLEGGSRLEVPGANGAQVNVEVTFKITEFEKAEVLDPSWTNPRLLCSQKGASVRGSLGPFGLLVLASKDLQEYTAVFFRIFKGHDKHVVLMCSDQSRSSLNLDNDMTTYGAFLDVDPLHKISLRSLIDHSIVESFGGEGKTCITARVYPTLAIDDGAHLYAFNNGTENVKITGLKAWTMKTARIN
ncbi:Glyco_hydro_32N domain-containing protein/Glyco_hydro_32C domain-containing protein, partial [Cephalotus follicularis]